MWFLLRQILLGGKKRGVVCGGGACVLPPQFFLGEVMKVLGDASKFFCNVIEHQKKIVTLTAVERALRSKLGGVEARVRGMTSEMSKDGVKKELIDKIEQFANVGGVEEVVFDYTGILRGCSAFAYVVMNSDYVLCVDDNKAPIECEQKQAVVRLDMSEMSWRSNIDSCIHFLLFDEEIIANSGWSSLQPLQHPYVTNGSPCWGHMRMVNSELRMKYLRTGNRVRISYVLNEAWKAWNLHDIVLVWRSYLTQDLVREQAGINEYRVLLGKNEKGVGRYEPPKQEQEGMGEDEQEVASAAAAEALESAHELYLRLQAQRLEQREDPRLIARRPVPGVPPVAAVGTAGHIGDQISYTFNADTGGMSTTANYPTGGTANPFEIPLRQRPESTSDTPNNSTTTPNPPESDGVHNPPVVGADAPARDQGSGREG